jgi:hypothetical protein
VARWGVAIASLGILFDAFLLVLALVPCISPSCLGAGRRLYWLLRDVAAGGCLAFALMTLLLAGTAASQPWSGDKLLPLSLAQLALRMALWSWASAAQVFELCSMKSR